MTLTLELPPEKEARLREKAARLGLPLDAYARRVLERDADVKDAESAAEAQSEQTENEQKRRAAVRAGYGKFAHCGPTPEERRRWKDEELRRDGFDPEASKF